VDSDAPLDDAAACRRGEFFTTSAGGLGGLALALCSRMKRVLAKRSIPLAPKPPHFPALRQELHLLFPLAGTSQLGSVRSETASQ